MTEERKVTECGRRSAEFAVHITRFDKQDIDAISMYLVEKYFIDRLIRGNRPEPTDEKQKRWIANKNDLDMEAINKLDIYRKELGLKTSDHIPLTEYQQEWVDYILCKTNVVPILPEPKATALQNINAPAEVLA